MRPHDTKAFNVMEMMILRDGVVEPLVVAEINGERILMDGHMRLECILRHKIKDFKMVILVLAGERVYLLTVNYKAVFA